MHGGRPDSASTRRRPTATEWRAIGDLFEALADQSPARRAETLHQYRGDSFIRDEAVAMLDEASGAGILDASPLPPPSDAGEAVDILSPGTAIGDFVLVSLIGQGGSGDVYLAERYGRDFQQRVALKLLQAGLAARPEQMEAERRVLSQLEHPSIARLIDGGTAPDGRLFMAMEYVDGIDIVTWCDSRKADLATRLRLFAQVCDAVSYAHRRLIVHRDLKPANMLVDADGRVRLLDFGIASLLDAHAAHDPSSAPLQLTPEYAAPEQLEGRAPTTAVDIYGLGATLFELLAGRPLWQFDAAPFPAALRRLLLGDAPRASTVAAGAQSVPAARLRGDLDAIIARATHEQPSGRYDSVDALADDIARHQAHRPVEARPGSRFRRAGLFVRRHPWGVSASAMAVIAVLGGALGMALQMRATAIERDIAVAEANRAEAINQGIQLMFRNAGDAGTVRTATTKDLLDETTAKLIASVDPNDTKQAAVILAFAELYAVIDDVAAVDALLTQALGKGVGQSDPVMTAELKQQLGSAKIAESQFAEARRLLAEAAPVWQGDPWRFRTERLEAIAAEAYMERLEGNRAGAIKLLQDSLPEAEAAYPPGSRDLLTRYNNLALHLIESNRLGEAEAILARAEKAIADGKAERTSPAIKTLSLHGGVVARRGDNATAEIYLGKAIALRRELFGPSAALASDLLSLARVLLAEDKAHDALPLLDEGIVVADAYLAPSSLLTLMMRLVRIDALCTLHLPFPAELSLMTFASQAEAGGHGSIQYGLYLRARAHLRLEENRLPEALADLDAAEAVIKALGDSAAIFLTDIATLRARIVALPH